MKKFVAILMSVCMLLCLAACSGSSVDAGVVGDWSADFDLTEAMDKEFEELGMGGLVPEDVRFCVVMNLEIGADGTYKMAVDKDGTMDSIENYFDYMELGFVEYMYAEMEAVGFSREDTDDYFVEYYGTTVEEYIASLVEESLDTESIADEFASIEEEVGYCKTEDGRIYFATAKSGLSSSEAYLEYSLRDGDLYITDYNGEMDLSDLIDLGLELPVVFKK